MPFAFTFDSTNRILRGRLDGRITDDVLKEFYQVTAAHIARTDPRSGVMDFSDVISFEVSPQTIRELARSAPAMPDPGRVRVIVAPADLIFGMARLFQLEGEATRPNLHIVRTLREAWAILGVQDPRFEPLRPE